MKACLLLEYGVLYGGAFEDRSWHIVKQTLNDHERIRLDRRIADAGKRMGAQIVLAVIAIQTFGNFLINFRKST